MTKAERRVIEAAIQLYRYWPPLAYWSGNPVVDNFIEDVQELIAEREKKATKKKRGKT